MKSFRLRIAVFCLFLMALGEHRAFAVEVPEARKKELMAALSRSRLPPTSALLEGEIAWLKAYIYERRKAADFPNYADELVQLGDEAEIKRVMEPFPHFAAGASSPHMVGQPRIIEHMVATMFVDEPAKFAVQGDVTEASPPSTSSALWILQTLARSWEMPPEVREWANEANRQIDQKGLALNESIRSIMRTWWKVNEKAIKQRDWAAVKPGQRLVIETTPQIKQEHAVPAPSKSNETPVDSTAVTPALAESQAQGASHLWVWVGIIAALALLVLATTLFRPRTK